MRPATPEDVPALVDLMAEFYAESGVPMDRGEAAASFGRLLSEPSRGAVWLLEAEENLAGYVVLCVGFSLEYGGLDVFVDDLFVRPAYRRRGLGRAGLAALLDECRRRGVRAVHLEVARDNEAAHALYRRVGFRDHGLQLLTRRLSAPAEGE